MRSAESIEDGLIVLLESGVTRHYMHADELDQVRKKGLDDSKALKQILIGDYIFAVKIKRVTHKV